MFLDQINNGDAGLVGDLAQDRPPGLLLHDGGSSLDRSGDCYVFHPKSNEVATSQLAVDPEIEKSDFAGLLRHLEADAHYITNGSYWAMNRRVR